MKARFVGQPCEDYFYSIFMSTNISTPIAREFGSYRLLSKFHMGTCEDYNPLGDYFEEISEFPMG